MDQRIEELKHRVAARKKELEAKLESAKADAHGKAGDAAEMARAKLDELERTVKDGWDNLGGDAIGRLNEWLKKD